MKSGRVLSTLVVLFAAAAAFAGEEVRPPVFFPPPEPDDFGALLDWVTAAEPAACEKSLEKASAVADRSGSAEVEAQYRLLRAIADEYKADPTSGYVSYLRASRDLDVPPVYTATAAFRAAQLQEEQSGFLATLGFAKARRLNPGGRLWILREGTWQKAQVDRVTEENFLRLNKNLLTYRATAWLAERIPLSGSARFLAFMIVFFAVIRILESPIVLKGIRAVSQGPGYHSIRWRYVAAALTVEVISIGWSCFSFATWQFIFDLEKAPLFWLSSLTAADPFLCIAAYATLVIYFGLMFSYFYMMPSELESRGRWTVEARVVGIVVCGVLGAQLGLVMWFAAFDWPNLDAIALASFNVFLLGLSLSGFILLIGCRVVAANWRVAAR